MIILDAEYEDGTPVEEGFAFYEVLDDIDEGKKKKSFRALFKKTEFTFLGHFTYNRSMKNELI